MSGLEELHEKFLIYFKRDATFLEEQIEKLKVIFCCVEEYFVKFKRRSESECVRGYIFDVARSLANIRYEFLSEYYAFVKSTMFVFSASLV